MSEILTTLVDEVSSPIETTNEPVPAPAPAPEVPKAPEIPKPQDNFSSKFAALTRKERELKEREKAYHQKLKEVEQRYKEVEERQKSIPDIAAKFKANPIKFAEEHGITYEQLIQIGLNEGNPTVEMQMQRMREEMDKTYNERLAELQKKIEEKELKENEEKLNSVKKNYLNHISSVLDTNADKFELTKAHNDIEYIYSVVEAVFEQTQQEPDINQVLELIESQYEEQANKILQAKKFQPKVPVSKDEPPKAAAPTLSNTSAAQVPVQTGERKLSRSEEIAEAAKLIRFQG
jgi:hypothetical protein